jgi:hypothetical protein
MAETMAQAAAAQYSFRRVSDIIADEAWDWAARGAIGITVRPKLAQKDEGAIVAGQWPPTSLLFGLYHRLIRQSGR